jgi:FMN phosphatase YigB (HAD superfamily)
MNQLNQKLILVDCDGVLVDWEWGFDRFMQAQGYSVLPNGKDQYELHLHYNCGKDKSHGLIREFNESPAIAFLPPLRDAVEYVRRLHSQGWRFHCITSLSDLDSAWDFRKKALDRDFGPDVIEQLICLPTGADKHEALEPYRDSGLYWVEDKPENADVGHAMGLRSILVEHRHNKDHECPYPTVKNWQEIYSIITS